jgi:hypothetical protein
MTESKADLYDVLKTYGMAMMVAQVLELALHGAVVTLGIYKKASEDEDVDALELIAKESRGTMGQLIAQLRQYGITDEVTEALKRVKDDRNHLAHRFLRANIHLLGSEEGCAQLVEQLVHQTATFAAIHEVISRATLGTMAAAGQAPDLSPAGRQRFGSDLEHNTKLQETLRSLGFGEEGLLYLANRAKVSMSSD